MRQTAENPRTAVYALTRQGFALALRIIGATGPAGARIFLPEALDVKLVELEGSGPEFLVEKFKGLPEAVGGTFRLFDLHIFIAAAGIAVRCIAPHLRNKAVDPAVLVLDQRGEFVISLLSGHLGGANRYAGRIAELIGATPVITTASDVENLPVLDSLAREKGLIPANPEAFKTVAASLLNGDPVCLYDPENCLGLADSPFFIPFQFLPPPADVSAVAVSYETMDTGDGHLLLHPRSIYLGIGCRRGVSAETIRAAIRETLSAAGIAPESLAGLASIEAKRDEPGLLEAAGELGLPVWFYRAQDLEAFEVSEVSARAMDLFGVKGVCEPAAQAAAHGLGQSREIFSASLLVKKQKHGPVTVAAAVRHLKPDANT